MDTTSGNRTGSAEQSDGALFDAYFDAVLDGRAEPPDTFFARHPAAGLELRQRVRAAYALHGADEATRAESAATLPFERLGDFRLLRRISQGGMGAVFEARQESLGRIVALKIVRPEIRSSPAARARFEREAAVVARLRHRHVVTVYAFGEDQGIGYIAMEFVPGRGLDELLRDAADAGTRLVAADVIRWGAEIARALACVHAAGVVHRDVKPSNIRITPEGRAVLLDFGVARDAELDRLTATGPLVGSPLYAAPEQIAGGSEIDERTDVYGLGATLYECLAGRPVVERGTVEQVLHRKLHTEPVPLRTLRDRLSRDLHVVVMKALAREPVRRYATAAEFADDLDAVLAFQPVKARPPGLAQRMRAWSRRQPALAATTVSLAAALFVALALWGLSARAEALRLRDQARALVTDADERVRELGIERMRTLQLESQVRESQGFIESRHREPGEIDRHDALEVEVAGLRRAREEAVHTILASLRRAERLDPDVEGVGAVRAALHLERYFEAQTWQDRDAALVYRDLVLEADPHGEAAQSLVGGARISVTTDPPGAQLHAFRYLALRELEGNASPRQVPVPCRVTSTENVGRWGLRVVQPVGDLPAESLIVAVDGEAVDHTNHRRLRAGAEHGGAAARVLVAGAERAVALPAGLVVRATAAPLLVGPDSALGVTPVVDAELAPGDYVLLLRAPDHEDLRVFVAFGPGHQPSLRLRLDPFGTRPRGFVRVVRPRNDHPRDFWMLEREVTSQEYLEFLNAPATLAEIDADSAPRYVPRGSGKDSGYWSRGGDGLYELPSTWPPDWPAVGVSYHDALAYVRWVTAERPPPRGLQYALPSEDEWKVAAGTATYRPYVFGDAFRPHWCNSCFSQQEANVEPVLGYPVDESPYGVFDMAGSATEWGGDPWPDTRGLQRVHGGSWAQGKPDLFRIDTGTAQAPDVASGENSFRLVLRPIGDAEPVDDADKGPR